MHLDQPVFQPHGHQPQAQPAAQGRIGNDCLLERPPAAARHGNINSVGNRLPLNALVKQRQREPGLEFDHDRILFPTDGDNVSCPDLALDRIALSFEQGFHRRIEICFARFR